MKSVNDITTKSPNYLSCMNCWRVKGIMTQATIQYSEFYWPKYCFLTCLTNNENHIVLSQYLL